MAEHTVRNPASVLFDWEEARLAMPVAPAHRMLPPPCHSAGAERRLHPTHGGEKYVTAAVQGAPAASNFQDQASAASKAGRNRARQECWTTTMGAAQDAELVDFRGFEGSALSDQPQCEQIQETTNHCKHAPSRPFCMSTLAHIHAVAHASAQDETS